MKRKIQPLPRVLRKVLILTAVLSLLGITGILVAEYSAKGFFSSSYFSVSKVTTPDHCEIDFSYLKGKNLLALDLKNESERLRRSYPQYKRIRLFKILPNRIFVDYVLRVPVALVKLSRSFCIDADAVLCEISDTSVEGPGLPVITGLEKKVPKAAFGQKAAIKEVFLALQILERVGKNEGLEAYQLKRIDVKDLRSISLFLLKNNPAEGVRKINSPKVLPALQLLEIKIPQDNIPVKISILGGLISQVKENPQRIEYIDLRFKEPVIKLKEE